MESRIKIAWLSLIVGSALLVLKFLAYQLTGSQAILSDALESIVNVLGALIALITIKIASKPADKDHPYGHGKAEYFSVAFEGGFIAFAATLIFYEAIHDLIYQQKLQNLSKGIYFVGFAGLVNGVLGIYLRISGKKLKSAALLSGGSHLLSDFLTSVGLVAGLFIVEKTKTYWIDPAMAIIFGFFLAKTGFGLVKKSLSNLMDAEDLEVIKTFGQLFSKHVFPGIIRIHHTRVIRAGRYHHVDAHIVVPEFWDVEKAHNETRKFEKLVFDDYPDEGEFHFHLDPCRKAYCEICDLENCPIRQKPFQKRLSFTLDELTDPEEPPEYRS
jgi:cation diffusion facilitator family transporter